MRKKYAFFIMLLLCLLFSSTVYAENNEEDLKTVNLTLTEENRYDPVYYQEPEEVYPAAEGNRARSALITLEEYVVNAWENFETEIDISAYGISRTEASANYLQILNNHPSFFYVVASVSTSYNASTNIAVGYTVEYIDTKENILAQQVDFNKEVEQAQTWVTSDMTDAEKALAVHDYLVLDCEYDKERLDEVTVPNVSHSAYGALVDKIAVCDGYSKAYACVLDELGIKSTIVSSDSMGHAWNMVSLGGEWYHVDATWDDPTWDCIGRVGHNYFLLSDAVISDSEHRHRDWSDGYEAVSTTYDNEFWSGVTSAFCYQNGCWYYSKYDETSRKTSLMKRTGRLQESPEETIYTEERTWNNWLVGYMFLDLEPLKNELYFNTTTGIYKLSEDESPVLVCEPECPSGQVIFGFTVRGTQACYALQSTPNIESKQVVNTFEIEGLQLPQITGKDPDETKDPDDVKEPDNTQKPDNVEEPVQVQKPNKVSVLKMSKATTNSLKFTWKKVTGAKYRVVLYRGNKAVSTVYTSNTSYTCKKLTAATLYTVKVTSYVENKGTKLYASEVSLKAATAPVKAKLSSVKKKGSTKAKLTWKKVTGADGYEIYMCTGNGSYKKIKTITKGKTVTFSKSGLKKGKSYKFRIRAYKKAGSQKSYGSYSNVKTIKMK